MSSNKRFNIIKSTVSTILILLLLCGCAEGKSNGKIVPYSINEAELNSNRYTSVEHVSQNVKALSVDDYDLVLENSNFALYYSKSVASIRLLDKSNNYVWGSLQNEQPENLNKKWTKYANSVVAIEVADKEGSVSTVGATKQELSLQKSENSINFKALFLDYNVSFNFKLELTIDGIAFSVDEKSIKEGKSFKLVSITFIPYFGSVEGNEISGYMFIPDGCGALIRFNGKRNYLEGFKKRVYGYDYGIDSLNTISNADADRINTFATDEQQVSIPVFGVSHGVNQNAFYAIIENGDEYATINADPAGIITDYNRVNASFIYRSYYEQPVNKKSSGIKTIQKSRNKLSPKISYHFLSSDNANYVGMAKGYREYLIRKNDIKPLKSNKNIPLRLDILVADVQKEFIGSSVKKITDFDVLSDFICLLNRSDINNLGLSLLGWQKSGLNGYNILNTGFDSVYSKDEMQSLSDALSKNGGSLLLYTSVFKGSKPQIDTKTKSSITMSQSIAEIKASEDDFYLADKYLVKPKTAINSLKEKITKSKNNLLLDDVGNMVYGEYLENNVTTRGETKKLICDAFGKLNKNNYTFVSPNSYLFKYTKAFYNSPIVSSQYVFETDTVPFLQIAVSGCMEMYSPYINCNLYSKADLLKTIDYNIYPSFILSGIDNYDLRNTASALLQSSNISDWKDYIIDSYSLINSVLKNTYGKSIINRTVLSNGFVKIDYENGSVFVNYNNKDSSFGDISVKAESAIFVSRGNKYAE